jgi:chromosome segregation ATPase
MASQIEEIRRLRDQIARIEAERDQARKNYAELAGLTQQYISAKDSQDERPEHERQLVRYQQGWQDAERHIDELTREGLAARPAWAAAARRSPQGASRAQVCRRAGCRDRCLGAARGQLVV